MSAESTLYATLTAAGAVTALVGSGSAARIYPDAAPEDTASTYIVFERANTEPIITIHGSIPASIATLVVSCWAATRGGAEALAAAAQAALLAASFGLANRDGDIEPQTGTCVTVLSFTYLE